MLCKTIVNELMYRCIVLAELHIPNIMKLNLSKAKSVIMAVFVISSFLAINTTFHADVIQLILELFPMEYYQNRECHLKCNSMLLIINQQ